MADFDAPALLDALPDPLLAADAGGRIVLINAKAERLLAWPRAELLGQPIAVVLPQAAAGRVPARRKDGAEVVVELSETAAGSWRVYSLRGVHEEPQVPGSERYRLVFEHAPVGLVHWDARGICTDVNAAMLGILGSTRALVIGLDLLKLTGDPSRERIAQRIGETLQGKTVRYDGLYISQTARKTTEVSALLAPIVGAAGEVVGGVGIIADVTERKRIEAQLARADRMASIGTLAAGVAHEINNPLVYVTLGLELIDRELSRLRDRGGPPAAGEWEKVREYARDALEGAERVRAIVRDLRTFSRADGEHAVLVDLARILESSINMAMIHIRPRARLVREPGPLPPVFADESRLGQVFLNLLVNAAQAIPEGAPEKHSIVVRTRTGSSGEALIEIEDTGAGIEQWKMERIFEPFWTDKPVGVGTGLGLSIVHGIVTALGGDIAVRSEPGRGSTFRVSLPGRSRPAVIAEPAGPPAGAAPPRKTRLLLIDDEPHLGVTLTAGLRDQAEIVSVRTGVEAVRRLAAEDFDLILCDLMMPDLTGMDVFEEAVRHRPDLRRRFVFMTGGAVTERAQKFLEQVPDQRLDKPFRLEQVEALLRK